MIIYSIIYNIMYNGIYNHIMINQQDKILYIIILRKQKGSEIEEKAKESKVILRMIITFL